MADTKKLKNTWLWVAILVVGTALSILIRGYFIFKGAAVADVLRMYQVGQSVLDGQNPYLTPNFYIYSPLWMYVEVLTLVLSRNAGLSFQSAIKLWPFAADSAITFLIYFILMKEKVKQHQAVLWSLVYILNPIAIIISSIHGQFDSLVSLFTLLAVFFLTSFNGTKRYLLSGLLLGVAIAFKSNPVLLLPFMLFYKKTGIKDKFYYLMAVGLPTVIVLLPFVSSTLKEALTSLMGYSGFSDFGLGGILRGLWYQNNAQLSFPYSSELLAGSKFIYLTVLVLLFISYLRTKHTAFNLYKYILMAYLLFLVIYSGISGQYFSWILFAAAILRQRMVIYFSLFGSLALLGFYLFFNPSVILSSLTIPPHQSLYMSWYFFANLFTWIICAYWLVRLAVSRLK